MRRAPNAIRPWFLLGAAAALLAVVPVASAQGATQDPVKLRERLRRTTDPQALSDLLVEEGLSNLTKGERPLDSWVRAVRAGVAFDLFYPNLFGDLAKEALLQIRFGQREYMLVFFEKVGTAWKRIPDFLSVGADEDHSCRPAGCPGYYCFDLVELRVKGEAAIVGRTCDYSGGPVGGEVEMLVVSQVTSAEVRDVARVLLRETGNTRDGSVDRRTDYAFEGAFPKRLVLRPKSGAARTIQLQFAP
jgi:hypothetical protein